VEQSDRACYYLAVRSENKPEGQLKSRRSGSITEAARREQIVRGAVEVLAEAGYNAASLAVIAERLGISKGVISYHFAGKAELLREVVRVVLAEAEAWMTPRVVAATTFTDALRNYIASNLAFLDAHREETIALTEVLANARATQGVPELFQESQSAAVAGLEALFTGGQHAAEFGPFSARTAAIALRASIDSVTGLLRDDPGFDLNGYGRDLVALFERASAPAHRPELSARTALNHQQDQQDQQGENR
jgi:AcrR family transcriptional regulator